MEPHSRPHRPGVQTMMLTAPLPASRAEEQQVLWIASIGSLASRSPLHTRRYRVARYREYGFRYRAIPDTSDDGKPRASQPLDRDRSECSTRPPSDSPLRTVSAYCGTRIYHPQCVPTTPQSDNQTSSNLQRARAHVTHASPVPIPSCCHMQSLPTRYQGS